MATEIKVPTLGESITEATVSKWLKRPGDPVAADEPIAELETDKVTLEVPAPAAGTLAEILVEEGANVPVGALLGRIADGPVDTLTHPALRAESPLSRTAGEGTDPRIAVRGEAGEGSSAALERSGPAVRKLIEETGLDARRIEPTGPRGRITKADVIATPAPVQPVPAPAPLADERAAAG